MWDIVRECKSALIILCVCTDGRDSKSDFLQDCVGGNSPLYPTLCSSAGKPNNLKMTQECIAAAAYTLLSLGKALRKERPLYIAVD